MASNSQRRADFQDELLWHMPHMQLRKGLVVGVDGSLESNEELLDLDSLRGLVSEFRTLGPVIWVHYKAKPIETNSRRQSSCLDADGGAEKQWIPLRDRELHRCQVLSLRDWNEDHYLPWEEDSALASNPPLDYLLQTLCIGHLFICGDARACYATAIEAARHGCRITLTSDCHLVDLQSAHRSTKERLRKTTGADEMRCDEILEATPPDDEEDSDKFGSDLESCTQIEDMVFEAKINFKVLMRCIEKRAMFDVLSG